MRTYTAKLPHVPAILTALVLGMAGQAFAQQTPPDEPEPVPPEAEGGPIVGDGQGLGPNEISLGNGIQSVCPRLVGRVRTGAPRSAPEVDLQRRCTEVAVARGNGVPVSDLNTVLRELNIDEAAAQNRGLVELASLRATAVIDRLQQLRLADAGAGSGGEAIAYQSGPGSLGYHFETGGAAGDGDFSKWSFYVNGALFSGDRDQTTLEAGFDLDGGRLTVGGDYMVDNNTFVGASLDYVSTSVDFDNGSELETDGIDVVLYGTRYREDGLYFEGTIGLGSSNYDQDRRFQYSIPAPPPPVGVGPGLTTVNQTASSDPDGDEFFASLGIGKDIYTGNGLTANFSANLNYLDAQVDGFTETIANRAPGFGMTLRVRDQDIESLRSSVGAQVSKAVSTKSGVIVPFASAEWLHEFENDSRTIVASFANDTVFPTTTTFGVTTEEPDEDYFRLGGGASMVFTGGLQGFVAVDTVLGLSDLSFYTLTAGIRKEF